MTDIGRAPSVPIVPRTAGIGAFRPFPWVLAKVASPNRQRHSGLVAGTGPN
jgi:hypothetical protein